MLFLMPFNPTEETTSTFLITWFLLLFLLRCCICSFLIIFFLALIIALILYWNHICQERTHSCPFILDKSLFNFYKELFSRSCFLSHWAPKCFWNGLLHDHDTHAIWSLSPFNFPFIIRCTLIRKRWGESTLNAMLRSMIARTIERFACHDLELEPFSIEIELVLAIIVVVDVIE